MYVWADGVYSNVRMDDRLCLLVIVGSDDTGRKEVLAVVDGYRESEASWLEVIEQLESQGLTIPPKLAIQASLRSRERFWDIRVPKIDSIFDNSLVPRPSWSPGVPPQHRKLVAATHRSPI